MAGDWIKMEKDTPEKPEILTIALALGLSQGDVFLACFRLWRWADTHTPDGTFPGACLSTVDTIAGCVGLAHMLLQVGWLSVQRGSCKLPRFDRHMGHSAKRRARTASRVQAQRCASGDVFCNAASVTKALPELEKSKRKRNTEHPPDLVSKSKLNPTDVAPSRDDPASEPPAVLVFPTIGKGQKEWHLVQVKLDEYQASFPGLDVLAACRQARQWIIDNPTRRKTARGMPAFLTRWLGKEQNRARAGTNGHAGPPVETPAERVARVAAERKRRGADEPAPAVSPEERERLRRLRAERGL